MAKARARVERSDDISQEWIFPVLPLSGAVAASALVCACECDLQLTIIVDKDRRSSIQVDS